MTTSTKYQIQIISDKQKKEIVINKPINYPISKDLIKINIGSGPIKYTSVNYPKYKRVFSHVYIAPYWVNNAEWNIEINTMEELIQFAEHVESTS